MIRMNEQEYAKLKIKHIRQEKPNPQYPEVKTVSVTLEAPPTIVEFVIPISLPSGNIVKGGNSAGNYHIRKRLQAEWIDITIKCLLSSGYRKHYNLKNCTITIISYYSSARDEIDTDNLFTKAIIDALKGRVFKDDAPYYVTWVCKSSQRCERGRERTEITIIGQKI